MPRYSVNKKCRKHYVIPQDALLQWDRFPFKRYLACAVFDKSALTDIILPEVAHVADDSDPHKHGACPEEDAADIITCEDLKETVDVFKSD